ncbi:MAG: ABC transporter ATP-binding protein [Oscillospiraceae bacterium]|nr:ABC transporter ATP-binding protein [Oscillospiraceae bacterium]
MLKVKGLNVAYGGVQALWDVSIEAGEGEIVALLGANGAGKTTLLNAITGVIPALSGEAEFEGRRIDGMKSAELTEWGIAYLPEGGRLFPDMTIRENLEMGAFPRRMWRERAKRLRDVYAMFPKLREREKQLARTMSGGEQQMLAMGRGMMSNPRLCLFDELSYGLAPIMVDEVFGIVRSLRERGITVLMVEQNAYQTLELADRAYVLENGRVTLGGTSAELLGDDYVRKSYLGL